VCDAHCKQSSKHFKVSLLSSLWNAEHILIHHLETTSINPVPFTSLTIHLSQKNDSLYKYKLKFSVPSDNYSSITPFYHNQMASSSSAVTQIQLASLDDADCYASIWEQILSRQREEDIASANKSHGGGGGIWGGRGKGGRGLARRTFQPKDVVIDNVRLQYLGGEVCLDRATIKFLHNHVYALVGRNGCGKSTLLQRIHGQKIPGWSIQWSSVYIPSTLPLDYQDLTPSQVLKRFYEESKRGSSTATESMIVDVENCIQSLDATNDREELERLCEELSNLVDALDPDESYMDQSSEEYLRVLNIDPHQPCRELSLSQQKEVLLLLIALCSFTNLILLDEPTNDLDIQGLFRLRQHIEGSFTTIVMVSHDVDLINDVATDIIDMDGKVLSYYPGNYDSYRVMKEQQETHYLKQSLVMEKKRDQLRSTLQNLKERPVPKRGGPRKKGKAIASHRKKIDRHEESIEELDSAIFVRERKGLTVVQRLKLAEVLKATPDKAVQFV
jgi:ATPase subunit of ABC transporter with duplicated ATPase domains